MKVLFLTKWFPSEAKPAKALFVREHARAAALANDITVLHLAGPHPDPDGATKLRRLDISDLTLGIPTYRVFYRSSRLPGTEFARFLLGGMAALRDLEDRIGPFDVIHAHEFDAAVVASLSKVGRRTPVVTTEHSTAFPRHALKRRALWRARYAFRSSTFVMPVSQALRESIAEQAPGGNMVVVPNTIDLTLFHPEVSIDLPGFPQRLTVVSRLNEVKGISTLLDACRMLAARREDWQLDIIGDGPGRSEYVRRVAEFDLNERIQFHGIQPRAQVAWFLQHSDLHIVPSNQETFCVAAVEALACGTPVVATRSGGPEEYLTEDIGLLVQPGDAEALAAAIDSALDRTWPSRVTTSSYARDRFSYEAVGAELAVLYRQAVDPQDTQ